MSRKLLRTQNIGSNILQLIESKPVFGVKEYILEYTDSLKCTVKPILSFKTTDFIEEAQLADTVFSQVHFYYEILKSKTKPLAHSTPTYNIPEVKDMLDFIKCGKLYHITSGAFGDFFYYDDFESQEVQPHLRKYLDGIREKKSHVVLNTNNFKKADMALYVEDRMGYRSNITNITSVEPNQTDISDLNQLIHQYSKLSLTPKSILEELHIH